MPTCCAASGVMLSPTRGPFLQQQPPPSIKVKTFLLGLPCSGTCEDSPHRCVRCAEQWCMVRIKSQLRVADALSAHIFACSFKHNGHNALSIHRSRARPCCSRFGDSVATTSSARGMGPTCLVPARRDRVEFWRTPQCHLVSIAGSRDGARRSFGALRRDNSDLPPLVNITNVEGMVVLGQFNGDGEKLYLGELC